MNPMFSRFFESCTVVIERLFWSFGITSDSWNRLNPFSLYENVLLDWEVSYEQNPWEGLSREQALQKIQTMIRIYTVFIRSGKADVELYSEKIATLREFHDAILSGKLESQFPSSQKEAEKSTFST